MPAAKPKEWSVPEVDGTGTVTVTRDKDQVVVKWFCGGARTFTDEDLADRIDNVERAKAFPDTFLDDRDSADRRYGAVVAEGGKFIADDSVNPRTTRGVAWDQLLDALKNALSAGKRPARSRKKAS